MKTPFLLAAIILLASLPLFAQSDPLFEQGAKPFGSYGGGDLDSINFVNGNLDLHIPLLSYPQRGKLSLSFTVRFHNATWQIDKECDPAFKPSCQYFVSPDSSSDVFVHEDFTPNVTGTAVYSGTTLVGTIYAAYFDDGSVHPLGNIGGTAFESIDGTALHWDSSSRILIDSAGIRYSDPTTGGAIAIEDPNGNLITGTLRNGWTDSMGRAVPPAPRMGTSSSEPSPTTTDYTNCTGSLPFSIARLWNVPGPNGGTVTFKFCYGYVQINTNLGGSTTHQYQGQIEVLQSIVLPNGKAWTFEYTTPDTNGVNYGDLAKVTLPTGGSISYSGWGMYSGCKGTSYYPVVYSRAVSRRTTDANDGTGPHEWIYFGGTVTDPGGSQTVHTITGLGGSCSYYETQTRYYQVTCPLIPHG